MNQKSEDDNELTLKEKIKDVLIKSVQMLILSFLIGLIFNWLGPILFERWTQFNFWILYAILEVGILMGFNKTREERKKTKERSEKITDKLFTRKKKD